LPIAYNKDTCDAPASSSHVGNRTRVTKLIGGELGTGADG
jgi:hypothetical protein